MNENILIDERPVEVGDFKFNIKLDAGCVNIEVYKSEPNKHTPIIPAEEEIEEEIFQHIGKWEKLITIFNDLNLNITKVTSIPSIKKEEIEYLEERTYAQIFRFRIRNLKKTEDNISINEAVEAIENIGKWRNFKGIIKELLTD